VQQRLHAETDVPEVDSKPLLQARRGKLLVGVAILACSSIVVLFSSLIGDRAGVEPWMLKGGGLLLFSLTLFVVARGLKCKQCGTSLLWYAMARAGNANWLDWLLKQRACPKCGSTDTA
jgi:hypothetical protein